MGYVAEIFDLLKDAGVYYLDDIATEHPLKLAHVAQAFQYIPADCQEKVLTYLKKTTILSVSLGCIMKRVSNEGLLVFDPYVARHEGGRPILVLKYNRYLMLKKDKGFVVCYRPDGALEYQPISNNLAEINSCFESVGLEFCKLHQFIIYMNAIEAGRGVGAFDRLYINRVKSSVIDRFVSDAVRYAYGFDDFSVTRNQLSDELVVTDKVNASVPVDKVFRVPETKTSDFTRMYLLSDFKIAVEVLHNNNPMFFVYELPDPVDDVQALADRKGMSISELADCLAHNIYAKPCVRSQFATYVLNSIGYIINFVVCYKKFDLYKSIRRLNDPYVESLEDLNDLMDYFNTYYETM